MDINSLTIGQLKELQVFFNKPESKNSLITDSAVGRYVIVRSRNEGINFGCVVQSDDTGVVLSEAQRIYYHKPKDTSMSWYEGVSISGLSDDSKISNAVDRKIIIEDYSITFCTQVAIDSIKGHKPNAQS